MIVVLMGVAGSGKSTIGSQVAERLGWTYLDADAYHSPRNIAKMEAGEALSDTDRREWLDTLARLVREARDGQHSLVLACSALKRAYRDTLTEGRRDDVLLVHLDGDSGRIRERMAARQHFMPPANLESQLATLEPPQADERALVLDISQPPTAIVDAVIEEVHARSARLGGS